MEEFDLYNIDRILLGRTICRGEAVPEDTYRAVVHVCIFGTDGRMLIQQRQTFKKSWAGLWDISVGGHVSAGETVREGAEREVREELGLDIPLADVRPALTINFDDGFDDIFTVIRDTDIAEITLQDDEVKSVMWADCDTIVEMIDAGTFIPYHKELIRLLFALKDKRGGHAV